MPNRLTLTAMTAMLRRKELSAVELIGAHLRHIERLNPKLNAFVSIYPERAREQAVAADRALQRGETVGPLHGAPLTIKDSFDLAGEPTLCGSRFRLGHKAARDATAAARLRRAGAIFLGKTNCPEFLYNYETDNHITGRTNSAWDPERTPGGSSGGEAAAISSCCSAGGLGSDGGGSIREPAHFSGIAGLKPTPGRLSGAGHFPSVGHPGGLLGVGGPMARTAEDVRLLFEAAAGYDAADPFSAPVPLRKPEAADLRIGVMEQFLDIPVQPAIRDAVRKAASTLEDLRFHPEPFHPRGLERAPALWWFFFTELPAPVLRQMMDGRESDAHWTGVELIGMLKDAPAPTVLETLANFAARDAMRAALLRQMSDYPVLLTPACGIPAFRHRERQWPAGGRSIGLLEAVAPLTWVNLLGLPAIVIPFALSDEGLPVGVQLVGRPYDEELLLEIAVQMEDVRGPFALPAA